MDQYADSLEMGINRDAFIPLMGTAMAGRHFGLHGLGIKIMGPIAYGTGIFQVAGVGAPCHEIGLCCNAGQIFIHFGEDGGQLTFRIIAGAFAIIHISDLPAVFFHQLGEMVLCFHMIKTGAEADIGAEGEVGFFGFYNAIGPRALPDGTGSMLLFFGLIVGRSSSFILYGLFYQHFTIFLKNVNIISDRYLDKR